jgi:uncharacterized membrane protein
MRAQTVAAGVVAALSGAACGQATFTWCGGVPNGAFLRVTGVSDDGSVVAGFGLYPVTGGGTAEQGFTWRQSTGIQPIGVLPGGTYSNINGLSASGQVAAGRSFVATDRAFRWTSAGGIVELAFPPTGTNATAYALSADGSIVVGGGTSTAGIRAFRWVNGIGEILPHLAGRSSTGARGVSGTGSVIVGSAWTLAALDEKTVRWTTSGVEDLGVPAGFTTARAQAVSADGTTIAGQAMTTTFAQPWRWRAGAYTTLGNIAGASGGSPSGISGDGNVIVGSSIGASTLNGFVWTQAQGLSDAKTFLTSNGADTQNWRIIASAVSTSGRILAGYADREVSPGQLEYRAWVVNLDPPPVCYPNCDASTTAPVLNVQDFTCFLQRYAAGNTYANCDSSTTAPALNVQDFTCFLQRYAAGCN